jgi:hypothetical protein
MIKKIVLTSLIMVFLGGCSSKNYTKQESVFIVFKTPTFRHADLGFMYESSDALKVELYSTGQAVMALEITKATVCMSLLECMGKKSFNKEVLSEYYPDDLIDKVFKAEAIFDGKNKRVTRNGFTQNISKSNEYNINYSVLTNQVVFRDTINSIQIKIKKM